LDRPETARTGGETGSNGGKAVSETVSYVIIAGLILSSMSIAYLNGYPALVDARDEERQKTVASAFSVFDDNMEDLSAGGSVKRNTEVNLVGDSLGADGENAGWVRVRMLNDTGVDICNRGCNVSFDPVVYRNSAEGLTNPVSPGPDGAVVGTDEILYENGAVIRNPAGNGSTMVEEPNWVIRDGVIISAVGTRVSNRVTGDGTFRVSATQQGSYSLVGEPQSGDLNVSVTVSTENPTAWETYIGSLDGVDEVRRNDGEVTMHVNGTDKAVLSATTVGVEVR
jgi:hypothetical protein